MAVLDGQSKKRFSALMNLTCARKIWIALAAAIMAITMMLPVAASAHGSHVSVQQDQHSVSKADQPSMAVFENLNSESQSHNNHGCPDHSKECNANCGHAHSHASCHVPIMAANAEEIGYLHALTTRIRPASDLWQRAKILYSLMRPPRRSA